MKSKRYIFSLVGVNIEKIDQKYGIVPISNLIEENTIPANATKIDELELNKRIPEIISFLDEAKHLRKCNISMIDFKSSTELDGKTRYNCFWDRNPIPKDVCPIGCPIKYVASRAIKSYHSELSKEQYTITEAVTEKRRTKLEERKDKRITTEKKDYYETDGIFCSFNCCMAFINSGESKHDPMYSDSKTLLLKMYNELYPGEESVEIMPAPNWRLLCEFGGTLSIEQFRDSFNKILYVDHGVLSYRSIGRLYEDQLKF